MKFGDFVVPLLNLAIVFFAGAGVWAVVEIALMIRGMRKSANEALGEVQSTVREMRETTSELARSINETLDEARPVIAKLDGVLDDVSPAVVQLDPLFEKTSVAVDAASKSLMHADKILEDVGALTGTGRSMGHAVTGAVGHVVSAMGSFANRVSGKKRHLTLLEEHKVSEESCEHASASSERAERASQSSGYFTYPATSRMTSQTVPKTSGSLESFVSSASATSPVSASPAPTASAASPAPAASPASPASPASAVSSASAAPTASSEPSTSTPSDISADEQQTA